MTVSFEQKQKSTADEKITNYWVDESSGSSSVELWHPEDAQGHSGRLS